MSINCTLDNANSTACIAQAQQAADVAFASSLATNAAIAGAVLLVFVIVRRWDPYVYEPMSMADRAGLGMNVMPPVPGLFGWFRSMWRVSDREIALKRGLDALLYLKLLKYLFFVTLAFGAYGWSVLFALHALGGQTLSGTAMLSMGNVAEASNFLVANMIGVVFNSAVASVAFYVLWRRFYRWRTRYKKTAMRVENFTVLLREVDDFLTENDIRETFERIFGAGKVSERVRRASERGCIVILLNTLFSPSGPFRPESV